MGSVRKFLRSAAMYGPGRALAKAAGRLGVRWRFPASIRPARPTVALIGCGQFGFATIAYFLARRLGGCFAVCYDPDASKAERTAAAYGFRGIARTVEDAIADKRVEFVYIASNHATHAPYAVAGLSAGKTVYVEKPVATSRQQLATLWRAAQGRPPLFVGYNRPHSAAVRELRDRLPRGQPITLTCTIAGHVIDPSHWYREPDEGTRICGNVGHWLDLAINLIGLDDLSAAWELTLVPADPAEPDDNVVITMTSSRGDLVSIVLTSRAEPFDGIHESIFLQCGRLMARIDDFQAMTVWSGAERSRSRYWPKDVGHRRAILQPFEATLAEATVRWKEVVRSSLLMLALTDMVREGTTRRTFNFDEECRALVANAQAEG